ncbi:MAG: hypothetical protein K6B67_01800 [Lachnospiraceae bacterium]|nr:hypothetical protein [Lachnospiraceae bacterium]
MTEKKIPAVQIAILFQALLFLALGSYGEMSFQKISLNHILVFVMWAAVFMVVDYTSEANIVHALKMGFVFAVLWCAIETGTFYGIYAVINAGFYNLGYLLYGLQNVLCLLSVLCFYGFFSEKKANIKGLFIILAIIVLALFVAGVYCISVLVPQPSEADIYFGLAKDPFIQEAIMRRVIIIFYAIEGIICSLLFK